MSFTGLERSRVLSGTGFFQQEEAPCTYIKIHEDLDVSLGVFIIKPGFKIPLHNHPKMHGLLKVVHGQVDISVYTKTNLTEATEIPPFLRDRTHLIDQGFVFPTTKEKLKSITSGNEAVILSPGNLTTFFIFDKKTCQTTTHGFLLLSELKNYHEIRNVGDGHAAFFDILAPPYLMRGDEESLHIEEEELRECHFFSEINHFNNNIHSDDKSFVWLRRVKSPDDYFCDTEAYLGPQIHSE